MGTLHKLMQRLYAEKHRCLIFCQMTKMMDILEEYLSWMQFTYFRMDGSTQLNDRRDMVDEFQRNNDIFCFLLSTRAGGLGVTLTGADTVIFYDNDWNPTMDAQATDRAHRIGQTKEVSVYRLITRHTVEENIVKRAKQKENVQSSVYSGGALRADTLKPSEIVGFLVDEEEDEIAESGGGFIKTKKKVKKVTGLEEGEQPPSSIKQPQSHKITYHYLDPNKRHVNVNIEDEEKSKLALEHLKQKKLNENEDEDVVDINEEFKDILDDDELDVAVDDLLGKEDKVLIEEDE
jgi:DNA helicase INO80